MKLIVGLGNIGKNYEQTRHNVGFMVIDALAHTMNVGAFKEHLGGESTTFILGDEKIMLLKPSKFMNLSGEVLQAYINYFRIELKDVLVVYDDMDLELGKFKVRQQGSSAGHNGLKNIELHLGTDEYNRIKVGISREKDRDAADYVLGKFNEYETEVLEKIIPNIVSAITDFIEKDIAYVMNKYNGNN